MLKKLLLPIAYPWAHQWVAKMAWGTAVFIALFLFLFAPFGLASFTVPYQRALITAGFGLITGLVLHLTSRALFPYIKARNSWKLWEEIVAHLFQIGIIAIFNSCYAMALDMFPTSFNTVFSFLYYTMLVGTFPTVFFTLLKSGEIGRSSELISLDDSKAESNKSAISPASDRLVLAGQNQFEQVDISTDQLLYMQTTDNYVTLYWEDNGTEKSMILRGSLTYFESQINCSFIARAHRSYIVNFNKVISWDGNAGGGKLKLQGVEDPIPVSRNYASKWNVWLKERLSNSPK